MKDPWINFGFEEEKLSPYQELSSQTDYSRIGKFFYVYQYS